MPLTEIESTVWGVSAAQAATAPDRMLMLSQFIDDFRRTRDLRLVVEKPPLTNIERYDVRIAATVESLCNELNLVPPDWVFEKCRFLDTPIYAYGTKNPNARLYFEKTSLPEFSRRKLYLGDNVLSRV